MKELWQKTFELLRAHRVLWAPYVIAELVAFSLIRLRRMAVYPMMKWLSTTTTQSVLGGKSETMNVDRGYSRTILLNGLLTNGTHYVNVCLLTLALVLTAILVLAFLRGKEPDQSSVMAALRPYTRGILLFALKFCIAFGVLTAVIVWPLVYLTTQFLHPSRMISSLLVDGWSFLAVGCIAWIMAPLAVGLLRPLSTPPADVGQKKKARYFALLTLLATSILQFFVNRIDSHVQVSSEMGTTAISALATLVINAPVAMLFTAFALIAADQVAEGEIRSALPPGESIEGLMPPPFPPSEN